MIKFSQAPTQRAPLTPDALATRQRMAQSLMQEGSSTAPVQHWMQGLARVAQAALGAYENNGVATQMRDREAYDEKQSVARRLAERVAAMDDKKAWDEYQRNRAPTEAEKLDLDYKRAQIEKLRQPDMPSVPSGYRMAPDGRSMEPIPGGPATMPPKKSVTELKQIHAADDEIPVFDQTIDTLSKARALITQDPKAPNAPLAYEGTGAGLAGWIGSRVPGGNMVFDEGRSKATDEYGTIMNMEAIKSMAETLKGATTNFELGEFVRILADPSQPREIRQRTIDRMLTLAKNKRDLARRRADEIRSGEYYRPEAGGAGASGVIDLGGGFSVEME